MSEFKIREILKQGEGLHQEFKECKTAINKDVYETVCAFLNRSGGYLLLGVIIDGKYLLYIYVPESSEVHRCNGRIMDRNEDGDLNITKNNKLVSALYTRKQITYSENRIYPFVTMGDLRTDLIQRTRKNAVIRRPDHPCISLRSIISVAVNIIKQILTYG